MREWGGRHDAARGDHMASLLGGPPSALTLLRDLIAQRAGIYYDDGKRDLLADKVSELATAQGMTSFLDYYYLLKYDADADRHWKELMDRLAVPETFFWRQAEQLAALSRVIAPRHFAEHGNRTLRIWSAACCTGEEPVSIAIALAEAGLLGRRPIEIVASDGSPAMVEGARRGVYGERSFRALPVALRDRYFCAVPGGGWRVDPRVRDHVAWTTANLLNPQEVEALAASDVIFCRNVFIYFNDQAIERAVGVFADRIRDPGYLFLGAPESLTRLSTRFELGEIDGAFVYVKRPNGSCGDEDGRPVRSVSSPATTPVRL